MAKKDRLQEAIEIEKKLTTNHAIAILQAMEMFLQDFERIPVAYAQSAMFSIVSAAAEKQISFDEMSLLMEFHENHSVID